MIFHQCNVLQEKPVQAQRTMSRKSARLLSKSKLRTQNADSDFESSSKRQKIEIHRRVSSVRCNQQFRIETKRLPISRTHAVTSSRIVPSDNTPSFMMVPADETDSLVCLESLPLPHPSCSGDNCSGSKNEEEIIHITASPPTPPLQLYRFSNHFSDHMAEIQPIVTHLDWADPQEMWDILDKKEENYPRSVDMLEGHPALKPYMRPVLYSWLTEVCDMYKLHKETYYLAVEYTDRYLLTTHSMQSCHLQLIGATALFLASKVEEIYPPKVQDFAYVCDGAFEDKVILDCEMNMLKQLQWLLSPLTPNMWVQIFLQVHSLQQRKAAKRKESAAAPPRQNAHCHQSPAADFGPQNGDNALMDLASFALATDSVETDRREMALASDRMGFRGAETTLASSIVESDIVKTAMASDGVESQIIEISLDSDDVESDMVETVLVSDDVESDIVETVLVSDDVESDIVETVWVSDDAESDSVETASASEDVDSDSVETASASEDVDSDSVETASASEDVDSDSVETASVSEDVDSDSVETASASEDVDSDSVETASALEDVDSDSEETALASEDVDSDTVETALVSNDVESDRAKAPFVSVDMSDGFGTECVTIEMGSVNISTSESEGQCSSEWQPHSCDTESCDEDLLAAWCSEEKEMEEDDDFDIMYPLYSPHEYIKICQLLDSAILDAHSLQFSYKVLAAAAVYLSTNVEDISILTGLTWAQLEPCLMWMKIHQDVINKHQRLPVAIKTFENIKESEAHLIQTIAVTKDMWEEAKVKIEDYFRSQTNLRLLVEACEEERQKVCSSPVSTFITPPRSTKKSS